ncbi:MAG: hypothetical protein COA36_16250 [Desulfotalea sp.]|nr:MAG: hypothetical protein COA36_16250 [Desulfotalea sp.]
MKALVIATKELAHTAILNSRLPAVMLPLLGKPFIQHVVEYLINQGVVDIEIVLCKYPEKIEALFGDGTRWGVNISYHLVKTVEESYRPLRFMNFADRGLLLINADKLPGVTLDQKGQDRDGLGAIFYCLSDCVDFEVRGGNIWSGWAWLSPYYLKTLGEYSEQSLVESLNDVERMQVQVVTVSVYLSIGTAEELLDSHRKIMDHSFSGLQLSATEVEPQLWLSKNVELHPDIEIIPPVFIGENSRLHRKCTIGPCAIIGSDCVVDESSAVANSIVMAGTYVGVGLELNDSLVDRNLLIKIPAGVETVVNDNFLLGSLASGVGHGLYPGLLSRCAAVFALLVGLPFLIALSFYYCLLKKRRLMKCVNIVRLPASEDPATWRDVTVIELWPAEGRSSREPFQFAGLSLGLKGFFTYFLPNLINVALGKLSLVGVKPRKKEELIQMEPDWRAVILRSQAGIISDAVLRFGLSPCDDDLYVAEVEYTSLASMQHNGKLLFRYISSLFAGGSDCLR